MPSLADIQREFARALGDRDLPPPRPVNRGVQPSSSRRFDVYRNNRAMALVEALQSKFPAVRRLVGEEYFKAAARAYIDVHPPRSPVLLQYGRRFGDFLETLPGVATAPYMGDVARLEWSRLFALHAADAEPAGIERLGDIPESQVNDVTLAPHPSLVVVASRWPVVSLWWASVDAGASQEVNMEQPEQALIVRPALRVGVHRLPAGGAVFVSALAAGATLGEAARQAMEAEETFDLALLLQQLFRTGAVAAVNPPQQKKTT